MATQEATKEEQKTMDKKVTLVGYTGETDMGIREWLTENFEEDYTAQEIRKTYSHYLQFGDTKVEVDEEQFNEVKAQDPADVEFVVEEEETADYVNSTFGAASQIRTYICKDNPSIDLGDLGSWYRDHRVTRDGTYSTDTVMRVSRAVEYTDMLVHPSEMTADNVVDDSEPAQIAFKFDVRYKDVTEEEMEWLDERVLDPMIEYLATHPVIERVRWTDCEKKTVEQMVCFDI